MDAKWIIGAVGSVLAVIVGFVGGVMKERSATERAIYIERLDNINMLRSATYIDFFTATAKYLQAREYEYGDYGSFIKEKPDDAELSDRLEKALWEYHVETKEARLKLAAFAPTEIVEALSDYYRERYNPENLCSPFWTSDVGTYLAMRRELLAGIESEEVDPEKMYLLMFNCRPRGSKSNKSDAPG